MKLEDLKPRCNFSSDTIREAIAEADREQVIKRIWRKDPSLWKEEEAHQKIISNSLGWLDVIEPMMTASVDLTAFARSIRDLKSFDHVMVCGMGGSSLCPEVLRQTFGKQDGFPELLVLDSTDPDQIAVFEQRIDMSSCLFIIASKSGTTTEPNAFYKYWFDRVGQFRDNPGSSFIAITDPGTLMEKIASDNSFRHIFLNPADIGGRYSALSYFGLAPAALMGLDTFLLLRRSLEVGKACGPEIAASENPGVLLGIMMAEFALQGRDKLTLMTDPKIAALGLWIEQLIAESTGKEGKGILPVDGEPLGPSEVYGQDRVFVSVAVGGIDKNIAKRLEALEAAGHPVVYLKLDELYDLGGHFFLWEFATAVAGWRLGINPFDQPNVQESKDATKELLDRFTKEGHLAEQLQLVSDGNLTIYTEHAFPTSLPTQSVSETLQAHLAAAKEGDYVALLNYLEETPEVEGLLQRIRSRLGERTKCATTSGYGPRFLHSTGQFHKGGPNTGVFLQITAPDKVDLPVPGEAYTFSVLRDAQALGDFRALVSRGRRAIRVDLGSDVVNGLKRLLEMI